MVDGRHSTRRAVKEGRASIINTAEPKATAPARRIGDSSAQHASKPHGISKRTATGRGSRKGSAKPRARSKKPERKKNTVESVNEQSALTPSEAAHGTAISKDPLKHETTEHAPMRTEAQVYPVGASSAVYGATLAKSQHTSEALLTEEAERLLDASETSTLPVFVSGLEDLDSSQAANASNQPVVAEKEAQPGPTESAAAIVPQDIPDILTADDVERIRARVKDRMSSPLPAFTGVQDTAEPLHGILQAPIISSQHRCEQTVSTQAARKGHQADLVGPELQFRSGTSTKAEPNATTTETPALSDMPAPIPSPTACRSAQELPGLFRQSSIPEDEGANDEMEDCASLFGEDTPQPPPPRPQTQPEKISGLALPKIASSPSTPRYLPPDVDAPRQKLPGRGSRLPPSHSATSSPPAAISTPASGMGEFERLLEDSSDYGKTYANKEQKTSEPQPTVPRALWYDVVPETSRLDSDDLAERDAVIYAWGDDVQDDEIEVEVDYPDTAETNGFAADADDDHEDYADIDCFYR